MWLEMTVRDEKGKVLMTSGRVDDRGALPPDTRMFNSEGIGKDFHFAIHPWTVTAFSRHETIPPRGYKDVSYGLPSMNNMRNISVETKLRYRQADQGVAEELLAAVPADIDLNASYGLKKVPVLPIVDMVVKTETMAVRKK
jgi:hypothetical protein